MWIGELAQRSGVTAKAIRYYERIGLLPPSSRTRAGFRQYDDGAVVRLHCIMTAKRLGLSREEIREIAELLGSHEPSCAHTVAFLEAEYARVIEWFDAAAVVRSVITRAIDAAQAERCATGKTVLHRPPIAIDQCSWGRSGNVAAWGANRDDAAKVPEAVHAPDSHRSRPAIPRAGSARSLLAYGAA